MEEKHIDTFCNWGMPFNWNFPLGMDDPGNVIVLINIDHKYPFTQIKIQN